MCLLIDSRKDGSHILETETCISSRHLISTVKMFDRI